MLWRVSWALAQISCCTLFCTYRINQLKISWILNVFGCLGEQYDRVGSLCGWHARLALGQSVAFCRVISSYCWHYLTRCNYVDVWSVLLCCAVQSYFVDDWYHLQRHRGLKGGAGNCSFPSDGCKCLTNYHTANQIHSRITNMCR